MRPTDLVTTTLLIVSALVLRLGHAAESEISFEERSARTSSRDIKIPAPLVAKIEKEYRTFLVKNEVSGKANIKRQLLNLTVELTQKSNAALHENVRIRTPLGGGVIDFNDFVTPLRGAFWLKVIASKEKDGEATGLRIFFVSKAKERRLSGDDYGAGCGKYMEITSFFNKKNAGTAKGFELYTADQRYLSVMGGTIVAFAFEKEALSVGTVSFFDSRYPEMLCD